MAAPICMSLECKGLTLRVLFASLHMEVSTTVPGSMWGTWHNQSWAQATLFRVSSKMGLDVEPGRVATTERRIRAGSVMPTGSEAGGLSSEDKKDWDWWQARESRAQAMLQGTILEAVWLDIEDLLAAADMWKHCDKMHEADEGTPLWMR